MLQRLATLFSLSIVALLRLWGLSHMLATPCFNCRPSSLTVVAKTTQFHSHPRSEQGRRSMVLSTMMKPPSRELWASRLRNQNVMERAAPSPCCKSPRLGPTVGRVSKKETVTLVGPMTLKESLQIRNNRLSIPVTVSGIHSHSKTSKDMIMYNLPSSRGTMTRTLTLQVTRNRQHDTSRPSVQPIHQDYVSTYLLPSTHSLNDPVWCFPIKRIQIKFCSSIYKSL